MAHPEETSPQRLARIGGALYLAIIVIGIFCEVFARGRLIVPGDAAATASHLRATEALWRAGIALDLFACACTVALAWILYVLLRPVSRTLVMLMIFFDLIGITLEAASNLNLVTALFPLGSAAYLKAFTPDQLNTLAAFSVRAHAHGFGISLLFFGFGFPIRGYLIFRSGFLPRTLGILLMITGLGYLTHGFALILAPPFADRIFPIVALPIFAGEASLCLWLLLKGVNTPKWREQAFATET